MEMKNLAGKWHYMEINPATGKPYESEHMDNGVSVQMCPNDSFQNLAPSLKESTEDTQVLTDSRDHLLDYIWREITTTLRNNGRLHDPNFWYANIVSWLDSQAAITERKFWECYANGNQWEAHQYETRCIELAAELDEWKAKAEYQQEILDCDCRDIRDFQNKIDSLTAEIEQLKRANRIQAESFAAIENENCVLRSKLNRIRELAERLENA